MIYFRPTEITMKKLDQLLQPNFGEWKKNGEHIIVYKTPDIVIKSRRNDGSGMTEEEKSKTSVSHPEGKRDGEE